MTAGAESGWHGPTPDVGAGPVDPLEDTGVAIVDLDVLFSAVKVRLRQCVSAEVGTPTALTGLTPPATVREVVLECTAALDQLHVTIAREIARRERLEKVLREAEVALDSVRFAAGASAGLELPQRPSPCECPDWPARGTVIGVEPSQPNEADTTTTCRTPLTRSAAP